MAASSKNLTLYKGYVSRLNCRGKLLISSIGNEALATMAPVPGEYGCTVFIKPLESAGTTNLLKEDSICS